MFSSPLAAQDTRAHQSVPSIGNKWLARLWSKSRIRRKRRHSAVVAAEICEARLLLTTFVVDADTGSDANPGTEEQPFESLVQAAQVAEAGDTVLVKDGTYVSDGVTTVLYPRNSGEEASPIVFQNYPGHEPVIEGTIGFKQDSGVPFMMSHYVHWSGFDIRGGFVVLGFDTFTRVRGWVIEHNTISGGTFMTTQNDPSNYSGIILGDTDGFLIADNEIHSVSTPHPTRGTHGHGLTLFNVSNLVVRNNFIHSNASNGAFDKQGGTDNQWLYNVFQDNWSGNPGIPTSHLLLNNQPDGTTGIYNERSVVEGNIFRSTVQPTTEMFGVRLLVQATDARVSNNTFVDIGGISSFGGSQPVELNTGLVAFNNVFSKAWNSEIPAYSFDVWDAVEPAYSDFNVFEDVSWLENRYARPDGTPPRGDGEFQRHETLASWSGEHPAYDAHSVETSPLFVDRVNGDFRLASDSPLIGAGRNGLSIGAYSGEDPDLVIGPRPRMTENSLAGLAYALDSMLGLKQWRGSYHEYYRDAGFKWLRGNSRWYFLTPDGSLHQFTTWSQGSPVGPLIAQFSHEYFEDPSLLHDAEMGGAVDLAALAFAVDQRFDLTYAGERFDNWGGQGEKWYRGAENTFFYLTPDGRLREWDRTIGDISGRLIATFDASFHASPEKLSEAPTILDSSLRDELSALQAEFGFQFVGTFYENHGGRQERWLRGKDGWYFLTATGQLYEWDRRWNRPVNGRLIADLGSLVYRDPSLLFRARNR